MLTGKIIPILIVLFTVISVCAQQSAPDRFNGKGNVISGTLVDEKTNLPVGFATVILHLSRDSSLVKGTYSGENGEFILGNLPEGNYYLQITFVGYAKKVISDLVISKEKGTINLGIVKLSQVDVQVKEVEVRGEKSNIEFRLDKKVINVTKNIAATALTALEILQTQPGVQKDANGDISIRGSSSFTVLVDGRPSVLSGSEALRQIAASTVESIEIMTNPSAKYDAEGTSGIVNVVTKKQTETLSSGLFNASAGTRGKYSGDATMNYKTGDININGGGTFRRHEYKTNSNSNMETFLNTGSVFNSMSSNNEQLFEYYNIKSSIDYTINPLSSLMISFMYGGNNSNPYSLINYRNWSVSNDVYSSIRTNNESRSNFFNTALYWNYKFTPKVDELVFEMSYTNATLPTGQLTNEIITDPLFQNTLSILRYRDFSTDTKRNEGRMKLNYSYKFNPKSTLEIGLQSNFFYKNLDIVNKLYNTITGLWDVTAEMTNQYDFRNNIYAAYGTYTNALLGFDFMLGVRAEYTDRLLEQKTLGVNYKYNQLDLFPSLSISTPFGKDQLQFSYSRRIFRPMDYWLNPFSNSSNSFSENRGNPTLLPQFSNSYELNYQTTVFGMFLSIQTYFRDTKNNFASVLKADNTGKIINTWSNIGKSSVFGASISPSISISDWLKIDPSIDLINNHQEGVINGNNYEIKNFNWMTTLNTSVIITPDTKLQLLCYFAGKYVSAQFERGTFIYSSVTLKQDFFEKKFSITLGVDNINIPKYYETKSKDVNFSRFQVSSQEPPTVRLTLSYNFNNFKRARKPDERVDLSTGE